jgi:hypothetical protein
MEAAVSAETAGPEIVTVPIEVPTTANPPGVSVVPDRNESIPALVPGHRPRSAGATASLAAVPSARAMTVPLQDGSWICDELTWISIPG